MTFPHAGAQALGAGGGSSAVDASRLQRTLLQRLLSHPLAIASAAILLALALLVLATPLLESGLGIDGDTPDLLARLQASSASHWLGTDDLGRDLLLRLLEGGRVSLGIGLIVALAAAVIGTLVGLTAGYVGGRTDALLMRLTDGIIALPRLPLLIVLAALDVTKLGVPEQWAQSPLLSFWRIAIIITLVGWTTVARLVRGATLSLREREFVRAARALGARPARIMFVHILPNVGPRHRLPHSYGAVGHPLRIVPELPRPRHPAADGELGQHADQCARIDLVNSHARGLAGTHDLRERDLLQFPRRRAAGRARSAGVGRRRSAGQFADLVRRMPPVAALVLRADIVDARCRLVELDLEGGDECILGFDVDVVRLAVECHADGVLLLHRAHLFLPAATSEPKTR
jgi:peptide/nickel transport system permease protein